MTYIEPPRPIYETQSDIDNETSLVSSLEELWSCEAHKLPRSYQLDYALFKKNRLVALLETKRRRVDRNKYPSIMVSASKRLAAHQYSDLLGVPALFVIEYDDGVCFIDFDEEPDHYAMGGRVDRNDPADMELVCHYNKGRLHTPNQNTLMT